MGRGPAAARPGPACASPGGALSAVVFACSASHVTPPRRLPLSFSVSLFLDVRMLSFYITH